MNKTTKILIIIVAIAAIVALVAVIVVNSKPKTNLAQIKSSKDLSALVNEIYKGLDIEMPNVQTEEVDITDSYRVEYATGLDSSDDIEYLVVSEPLMSSQAYSLVLAKVKDGVDANEVAQKMNENINLAKWICVSAEKAYTTSSGNVVFLVMASEDIAKPIYEKFKSLAGTIAKGNERTEAEPELPPTPIVY